MTGCAVRCSPTAPALELAQVADIIQAEARLEPLLAAQDRFDAFQG